MRPRSRRPQRSVRPGLFDVPLDDRQAAVSRQIRRSSGWASGSAAGTSPITEHLPDLPANFVRVLDKLLAHKPHERFATAAEAADALQSLIRPKTRPAAAGAGCSAAARRARPVPAHAGDQGARRARNSRPLAPRSGRLDREGPAHLSQLVRAGRPLRRAPAQSALGRSRHLTWPPRPSARASCWGWS